MTYGGGERDFYVESQAVEIAKDGQKSAKVVILVFSKEPQVLEGAPERASCLASLCAMATLGDPKPGQERYSSHRD